jgi:hypothetical protein
LTLVATTFYTMVACVMACCLYLTKCSQFFHISILPQVGYIDPCTFLVIGIMILFHQLQKKYRDFVHMQLDIVRAFPAMFNMWPCKNICHIQVLVISFFPTPPIKLRLRLQIGGRLQSNSNPLKPIKLLHRAMSIIPCACVFS